MILYVLFLMKFLLKKEVYGFREQYMKLAGNVKRSRKKNKMQHRR